MKAREKLYRRIDPIDGYVGFLGRRFRSEIKAFSPDLVHFSAQYPAGSFAELPRDALVTAAFDSTRQNMERQTAGKFWSVADFRREARLLTSIDHLFASSEWAAASAVVDCGVPRERVDVVLPSLDPAIFPPRKPPDVGRLPRIVFIGGDFHRKGGGKLVSWAHGPLKGLCEVHLISCHRDAHQFGGDGIFVHQGMPHTRIVNEVLPSADLLVHPTQADMSAYVVVEAAFSGVPAVASAIGGIPELVREGVTGWTRRPDDDQGFVELLSSLLADPARLARAGTNARNHAHRCFNAVTAFNRLFDTQLSMIAAQRR